MSWDVLVQDLPTDAKKVADIPDDFRPSPLGRRSDLIRNIQAVVPFADFSDPSWGLIDGDDFSIEVSLGESDTVESFSFRVRGSDMGAAVVAEILGSLKLRALDTTTGEFFDPETAAVSLGKWRKYLNRTLGGGGAA